MAEYNTTGTTLKSQNPVAPPLPEGPPVVVDAPYASQDGTTLNCTMGNWENVPQTYLYQWRKNGTLIGRPSLTADYAVTAEDVGATYDCQLTVANAVGSAQALSNALIVVA